MATLIKYKRKWFYTHKEYMAGKDGFPGMVQQFAGAADKIPEGWLLCDGTEYTTTEYPDLYDVIGNIYGGTEGSTFKVPDYRECVLVGAGQNGTDAVATHDVYDEGQFKNDQMQRMTGYAGRMGSISTAQNGGVFTRYSETGGGFSVGSWPCRCGGLQFNSASQVRSGTTTHAKQKGVNYIIHV